MRSLGGRKLVLAALLSVGVAGAASARGAPAALHGHRLSIRRAALQLLLPPSPRRLLVPTLPRAESGLPSVTAVRQHAPVLSPRTLTRNAGLPVVGFSEEGIPSSEAGGFEPADVSLSVGPTYLGEAVNTVVAFWRVGAPFSPLALRTLGSFFTTAQIDRRSDQMSDPRLIYDQGSARWFFVAFDVTRGETDLAASTSDDPSQSWWIYNFPAGGCPDQPRIAASDSMVAVSYNLFSSCATRQPPYVGGVTLLLDKQALETGAAPATSIYGPDARFIAITPAAPLDGGSTIYMVSTDYQFSQVVLYTASYVGQTTIPIQRAFVNLLRAGPAPYQSGTSTPLDPGDNRVQDAFVSGGNIWLAANDGCNVTGAGFQDCIRYVELSTSGQVLDQREEALANGRSAFYPAFRPDASGNLFSIYGFSSPNDFPGLAVTVDPGHQSGYSQLRAGQGADTSGRWGDYFSAARDPRDGTRVWVAGAYGLSGGWGTFIAALSTTPFTIPNPTTPTPPPSSGGGGFIADTSAPVVRAIPSSGRVGSVVHLRYRLSDNSRRTRERIRVRHAGRVIGSAQTQMAAIVNGSAYYVTWNAPLTAPAHSSFCVVATDPSGNESQPSCAPLLLTGGR